MPGIIQGESQIPETFAGPDKVWWQPGQTKGATFLTEDLDAADMIRAAGLDWTVSKRPMLFAPADAAHRGLPVPKWVTIARDSDDAFLGMVTPSYHEFQNAEMGKLGEAVLGQGGHAHCGGSLYGGRMTWLTFRFDREIHVKGDGSPVLDYFNLMTGHDGRHGLTAFDSTIRAICGNTLGAAYAGSSGRITLRHTTGMEDRTPEIRNAIDLHVKHVDTMERYLNALADRPMTIEEVKAFTVELIPAPIDVAEPVAAQAKRDFIAGLFQTSPTLDGLPFTAYRAYQATIEFADHGLAYKTTKVGDGGDRRAEAIIDGAGYDLKTRAAKLLIRA